MHFELIEAYLFTAVGILGVLVLAWIGWSQTRAHFSARRALRREHGLREWLSHEPVRATRLDPLSELRSIAVEATHEADLCERFAEETRPSDPELAAFFAEVAETEGEIADSALDLLRHRLPEQPHA